MRHTRPRWELIVVDNGSTDGTNHYLAGVQDASPAPVVVITNTSNQGFPAAINQGLRYAKGDYLVLLNNDVVVTHDWLDQLIALTAARSTSEDERADEFAAVTDRSHERSNVTVIDFEHEIANRQESSILKSGPSSSMARPLHEGEAQRPPSSTARAASTMIGLAGPMSNYAAPPQLVEYVPYGNLGEMHTFALRWRDQHRGQWFTVPKLSGFCLLMKRAVYEAIGGLDERFGLGFFDDDDLAERARRAGFELAVAHDLFVHHFGSRTFIGNGVDAEKLLDENARRFAAKWGVPENQGRRVSLRAWRGRQGSPEKNGSGDTQVILGSEKLSSSSAFSNEYFIAKNAVRAIPAKVSLTMIVRNEEANLPKCLASACDLFDEIIVVDTGSTDRTVEIARSFGARVFDFIWVDDFAAARNAALARATGDFAFWLDADDVVDPPEREKLKALLDRVRVGEEAAYVVRCACDPSPDGTGGETVVDHIRLFPLREDFRWTYRVHEQILPALRRAKLPVRWTDIRVRHTGYVDQALRARKLERDLKILREELEDRPDDPFVSFNLGAIAIERKEWQEALGYLRTSLAGSAPTDSITCKLFALIARAHQMLGDAGAALRACSEGLVNEPDDAELWFRKAVIHRHQGEQADAERSWRRILTLGRGEQFRSVDQGIYGHLTRRNLAALAAERGDQAEAEKLWAEVLAECPGDREALSKLEQVRPVNGESLS